jgi:uncharacterized protein
MMHTTASAPAHASLVTGAAGAADRSGAAKLIVFFIGAYALAWLPFAVAILAARGLIPLPAPEAVLLTLATLGIGLAGIGVAALESGGAGVRSLLGQILRWRVRPAWYVAAILVPALFPAGAFLLGLALGKPPTPTASLQVWLSLPLVLVAFVVPALLEEIGWRGYALPRLQHLFGRLPASVLLGVIWAGVHLPLWLLPDFGFASQSVTVYFVQVMAISVVLAWLYNATGGSLLLTGLAHAAVNGWPMPWNAALQALPDETRGVAVADFHALITVATVVIAVLVVLATRRRSRADTRQTALDGVRAAAQLD